MFRFHLFGFPTGSFIKSNGANKGYVQAIRVGKGEIGFTESFCFFSRDDSIRSLLFQNPGFLYLQNNCLSCQYPGCPENPLPMGKSRF